MQIHDLNTKALTNPAYVAFDDGTDTYKADFKDVIDTAAAEAVADADLTDNTVAFTSGDAASPTAWTAVSVLTSGLPIKTLFNRISTMIKNVRYIWSLIGTTALGTTATTITGAIAEHEQDISGINSELTPNSIFTASLTTALSDGSCRGLVDKTTKTVRITLYARNTSQNIPTNTTLFSLPQSARPSSRVAIPAVFILENGTVAAYYLTVETSGAIMQGFSTSIRNIFAVGEYATA